MTTWQLGSFDQAQTGIKSREAPAGLVDGGKEIVSETGGHRDSRREFECIHRKAADNVLIDIRASAADPSYIGEAGTGGGQTGNQIDQSRQPAVRSKRISQLRSREGKNAARSGQGVVGIVVEKIEPELPGVRARVQLTSLAIW